MSSAVGKRDSGRGHFGRSSNLGPIRYLPRPHLDVVLRGVTIQALIDTGAEVSCLNYATLRRLWPTGMPPTKTTDQVRLADGSYTKTGGAVTLTITYNDQRIQHRFRVLPKLDSALLIGVDLWAKLQIPLIPPAPTTPQEPPPVYPIAEGLVPRSASEEKRLQAFLARELTAFEQVQGPTDQAV